MTRPRLLDLFCCAGGASMGYHRAGFDVYGIDIEPQPHYPHEFHQADALEYVAAHGHKFDAIAASPPCQAYSITRHVHKDSELGHTELIPATREALRATGKPYVIENVEGARPHLIDPVMLCGTEFHLTTIDIDGRPLELRRHRLFESNVWLYGAGGCQHRPVTGHRVAGSYGGSTSKRLYNPSRRGGYVPTVAVRRALLGVDWPMNRHEINQAIPPAYTEFIGAQLLDQLVAA